MTPPLLDYLAGPAALEMIRDGGLTPDAVTAAAGAAGGPKWLVLSRLDRAVFGRWLNQRSTPLSLVGASIGAWRFAALSRRDPLAAIRDFENAYIEQRYQGRPTPAEVSAEGARIQNAYFPDEAAAEVLDHPTFRLNIMTVRGRGLLAQENKAGLLLGVGLAALANALDRKLLRLFFQRTVFHDPRQDPPFGILADLPADLVRLTPDNLPRALLASGSIPLVMDGVGGIPGAPPGRYRDGGVTDYHLDLPWQTPGRLVLFVHYQRRIVPGWFDKRLKSRRPRPERLNNLIQICPSPRFTADLPLGRIPDRRDFDVFFGRDEERIACWRQTVDMCRALEEEFLNAVESGQIREYIRPIDSD